MPPRQHLAQDWAAPGEPEPPLPVGIMLPARHRQTRFPLKDRRTLFSDEEIQQARENIVHYPSAQRQAAAIMRAADYWVTWEDDQLRNLITSAEVPRAFDCSPAGCPKCGKRIFEVAKSTYPWRIDPQRPFQVECPVCASVFPSNDYGRFYRSGFQDRSDFDGPYVDDGRGWVSPDGERFWFVAHANHWTWYWHPQADNPSIIKACEALGRAWLVSGDPRYAHKAAVILHRVAEVYPNMDHATQSRFGEIMARTYGEIYGGKVVNSIWESYLSAQFAETYDAIWETIDNDTVLQELTGCSGYEIRSHIEANLLEEIIDGYYTWKTRGNYGMHQRSLLMTVLVRQYCERGRHISSVLDKPDGAIFHGLRYALYNFIWRDGHPYEVGDYNFSWVSNFISIAALLQKLGVDVTGLPRLRRMVDAPLSSLCIGCLTPAIGDSQTVYANPVGTDAGVYQQVLRIYGEKRYVEFLSGLQATGEDTFTTFESLFHPPIPRVESTSSSRLLPPQPSRLLSGFGLSILNNDRDTVACSLYHGLHRNHRHFDRLHFDIFARGQALMPDLGYPDAMNTMVAGIFSWSLATISHNTVTVDEVMQPGNEAGRVEWQCDGGGIRALAVNAPGTYPQCPVYRRTMVMIDVGEENAFFVDFFDVQGGRQHDYSLHGPPGEFQMLGGEWSLPASGTLAGEEVEVGTLYDAPDLASPENTNGYASYRGSGFQHLERVRRHLGGAWIAEYAHERDPDARLRLRILPQPGQEIYLAEARVSPVKWPQILRYLIARNTGQQSLVSRFVSVIEPYGPSHFLGETFLHELDSGTAVEVLHRDGKRDVILMGDAGVWKEVTCTGHRLGSDARVAVFRMEEDMPRLCWSADGTKAVCGERIHVESRGFSGTVVAVCPETQRLQVRPDSSTGEEPTKPLKGQILHFGKERSSANSIRSVHWREETVELELNDDLVVGKIRLKGMSRKRLETRSQLMLAPTYRGCGLLRQNGCFLGRIHSAGDDWIELEEPLSTGDLEVDEELILTQTFPGDHCEVTSMFIWRL